MNNKMFSNSSKNSRPSTIRKFKYKTENDEIDITPLFVFIAGLLYDKNDSDYDDEMYKIVSLQRDLMKETIGKHFLSFIEKDEKKYSWQSDPEALFYDDEKITTLYENSCTTLFKTIHLVDHLVFLNLNYDFSDKINDFMQFSFLFELYKLCLQEKEYNRDLISYVNMFFIKNSILSFTKSVKDVIIVKEGATVLDYIAKMIVSLASPQNSHLKFEEQTCFTDFIKEFPEIATYLSINYSEKDMEKHFETVYNEKSFAVYYEEKAKPYYNEYQFLPLITVSGLTRKFSLYAFESLLRDTWFHSQIQYHTATKNNKIKSLDEEINNIKRENKNLTRNFAKKTEENERLAQRIKTNEEDKNAAIQKVKDESVKVKEELNTQKSENSSLKNKLAKQLSRIESLSEKINTQLKILNKIPNIQDFIDTESELSAATVEELLNQPEEVKPTLEEMIEVIRGKRLFFIHGIQGYEKNLEEVFDRYEHVCINDKVANFHIPQGIDGVVVLVKTTPHAHLDRAIKMKQDWIPMIPSTNKNIDLVIEDIYNFYNKN